MDPVRVRSGEQVLRRSDTRFCWSTNCLGPYPFRAVKRLTACGARFGNATSYNVEDRRRAIVPFALDNLLSRQSNIGQSRSSVLNPLQWMTVIIVAGLASFVYAHAQSWLIILMAVLLSSTFILFAAAFVYFMIKEPGTLRSEDYSLAKHALDKGYFTPEIVRQLLSRDEGIQAGKSTTVTTVGELKTRTRQMSRKNSIDGESR